MEGDKVPRKPRENLMFDPFSFAPFSSGRNKKHQNVII